MDELHRHRPFTDSRSYAFYRTMAHVANCKEAGNIGLEKKGVPVGRPSLGTLAVLHNIRTGKNKPAIVSIDQTGEPVGARECPNKNKHGTGGYTFRRIGVRTKD